MKKNFIILALVVCAFSAGCDLSNEVNRGQTAADAACSDGATQLRLEREVLALGTHYPDCRSSVADYQERRDSCRNGVDQAVSAAKAQQFITLSTPQARGDELTSRIIEENCVSGDGRADAPCICGVLYFRIYYGRELRQSAQAAANRSLREPFRIIDSKY